MRNKLSSLGIVTVDSSVKNEEGIDLINKMELSAEAMRMELIINGKRGKMSMKNPKCTPDLHVDDKIQDPFNNLDDSDNTDDM